MAELKTPQRRFELFPLLSGLVFIAIGSLSLLAARGVSVDVGWAVGGLLLALGCLGLGLSLRRPPSLTD
ncbi:MAG: hypothetical protein QOJ92_2398 [Frankiales bacterium]|nr:hypothetical protein [Frankiales bacterium]